MRTDPSIVKRERLLKKIVNILESRTLEKWQRDAIQKFWKFIDFQSIKLGSKRAYLQDAKGIIRRIDIPPEEWTEQAIIDILDSYRRKEDGEAYASRTRNHIREAIKYYLLSYERIDLLQKCESSYSTVGRMMKSETPPKAQDVDEDSVITHEQMRAIASRIRMYEARAFYWVKWDTGARLDDLCMIRLCDVEWDEDGTGVILTVPEDTKTGKRPIVPRYSLGWFRQYMSQHPFADMGPEGKYIHSDVAVFLNDKGEAWPSTDAIGDHFQRAYSEVLTLQIKPDWQFKEHVPEGLTPKSLRTSAVNRDMDEGLDAETNAYHHGHSVITMMKRYRKVSKKREVKSKIDALAGIKRGESKKKDEWSTCPMCFTQNQPQNQYCANCGNPVTVEAMRNKEEESASRERRIAKIVLDMLLKDAEGRGLIP